MVKLLLKRNLRQTYQFRKQQVTERQSSRAILDRSRTIRLYMRRALVLLCLFVFIALPQAYASMAYASTSPFQHAGVHAASADCRNVYAHADSAPDAALASCDAEECDNDPITLYRACRQALSFCAIVWRTGPAALAEADVWQAMRPPRVRS
ncbi:hypothetical protein CD932_27255 [Janthinobacterium sp. PC23-8]|nr:hypothetical protein CD932_27255 [Janthinobacterium sp. PC23-8]